VKAVKMPELNDATLAELAAICGASTSPDFFSDVRTAVDLTHFRERLRRHAQSFEKIAKQAATLLQYIDALSPDARAVLEEMLGKKNDIAESVEDLVRIWTSEHATNAEYEETPLVFNFITGLSVFEGLAHWIARLPMPYTRGAWPGPLYIQIGVDGKPLSSRRRGRPEGSKRISSGYNNIEVFVEQLTLIVTKSGGRLTYSDHHHSGTLVAALDLLRDYLPPDCCAMPSRATMRRIKERSTAHLNKLTPEMLYDGAVLAGPEHYEAIAAAVRATGVDPATIDPLVIACAAEICAREGAQPEDAFPIALVHSLVESGWIDRKLAKHVVGDDAAQPEKRSKSAMRRGKKAASNK
jgi:hypothetical protein